MTHTMIKYKVIIEVTTTDPGTKEYIEGAGLTNDINIDLERNGNLDAYVIVHQAQRVDETKQLV